MRKCGLNVGDNIMMLSQHGPLKKKKNHGTISHFILGLSLVPNGKNWDGRV